MTNEINYAFIDENNKVINTAIVIEEDNFIIEFLKKEYNAKEAVEYNLSVPCYFGKTEWTGKHWKNPCNYLSWVWNDELGQYEAPTPYPQDGEFYYWDENTTSWLLLPPA